jgi:hypothetical protein
MDPNASGSAAPGKDDLDVLMKKLGLREEDLDDVVYEDEPPPPATATRWLAIARVHTDREFRDFWFYKNMRTAWDTAQEVKFRSLDDNMYTVQFSCLGDWDKVMDGGPWTFRGNPVLLAPYDGFTKPSEIALNTFKVWIQIHDLPDGFKPMLESLASKVGEVIVAENRSNDFSGNFFRVRIKCDVRRPLKNAVSMVKANKRQIFLVKYERLPDWCALCGMLGHLHTEHGDGVHSPEALVFKDLKATWSMRMTGSGRTRGRGAGRGRGRGDREVYQEDLSIPEHNTHDGTERNMLVITDHSRKRDIEAQVGLEKSEEGHVANIVNALVNQFQSGSPVGNVPPSPPPKREPKRVRTTDGDEVMEGQETNGKINLNLAGSMEGHRQDQ